jgi:hypothetical protein
MINEMPYCASAEVMLLSNGLELHSAFAIPQHLFVPLCALIASELDLDIPNPTPRDPPTPLGTIKSECVFLANILAAHRAPPDPLFHFVSIP